MKLPEGTMLLMPGRCEVKLRPAKGGVRLSYWEWFSIPTGESAERYLEAAKRSLSWLDKLKWDSPGIRVATSGCYTSKDGSVLAGFEILTSRECALTLLLGEFSSQLAAVSSWDYVVGITGQVRSTMKGARLIPPGASPPAEFK